MMMCQKEDKLTVTGCCPEKSVSRKARPISDLYEIVWHIETRVKTRACVKIRDDNPCI